MKTPRQHLLQLPDGNRRKLSAQETKAIKANEHLWTKDQIGHICVWRLKGKPRLNVPKPLKYDGTAKVRTMYEDWAGLYGRARSDELRGLE